MVVAFSKSHTSVMWLTPTVWSAAALVLVPAAAMDGWVERSELNLLATATGQCGPSSERHSVRVRTQ